jgi:hypothetical protein
MNKKTDWDAYYSRPSKISGFARQITINHILRALSRYRSRIANICELGGANSCIYADIHRAYPSAQYCVVDNNATGMALLKSKNIFQGQLILIESDIMQKISLEDSMDVVFSIGLIEHFSPLDTAIAIQQHFSLVKEGGLVVITFPTPTWLYRCARKISEALGLWIFHDERPLTMQSVVREMKKYGDCIDSFINWKIVFTQGIVVIKAKVAGDNALAVSIGAVD